MKKMVLFFLVVMLVTFVWLNHTTEKQERTNREQASEQRKQREEDFNRMTPKQHLETAKQLLADDTVELCKKHLLAIDPNTPEAAEGQRLLKQIKSAEAAAAAVTKRVMRDAMAKKLENRMLDEGYSVDVNAIGTDHTVLRIKWILTNKALAHQFAKQGDFFASCRSAGFRRVEITDGYDETWYWDLARNQSANKQNN